MNNQEKHPDRVRQTDVLLAFGIAPNPMRFRQWRQADEREAATVARSAASRHAPQVGEPRMVVCHCGCTLTLAGSADGSLCGFEECERGDVMLCVMPRQLQWTAFLVTNLNLVQKRGLPVRPQRYRVHECESVSAGHPEPATH